MMLSMNTRHMISVPITRRSEYRRKINYASKVVLGATVTLLNTKNNEFVTYKIVGENEADLKRGTISFTAPLSHTLIGKFEGQLVNVIAPGGTIRYKICVVKYA